MVRAARAPSADAGGWTGKRARRACAASPRPPLIDRRIQIIKFRVDPSGREKGREGDGEGVRGRMGARPVSSGQAGVRWAGRDPR